MEALILSGEPAAGKTTVARILADRLSLKTMGGGDILKELAKEHGYSPTGDDWWDTKEGIEFLKKREIDPEFDIKADKIMKAKVEEGNIVLTSYTAPWISEKGFKVWLQCSAAKRAERMSKRDNTTHNESENAVHVRDKENYSLYKELYNIEFGKDLSPFHLIIDTSDKTPGQIAEIILTEYEKANK
jgi:cytidylate kinase